MKAIRYSEIPEHVEPSVKWKSATSQQRLDMCSEFIFGDQECGLIKVVDIKESGAILIDVDLPKERVNLYAMQLEKMLRQFVEPCITMWLVKS